jgi:hypothetical protein
MYKHRRAIMNLTEISSLVETFKNYIPTGPVKPITMKAALRIQIYVKNFHKNGESLIQNLADFDEYFYNRVGREWIDNISYYTVDASEDSFLELFQDFRFAAHRAISEHIKNA